MRVTTPNPSLLPFLVVAVLLLLGLNLVHLAWEWWGSPTVQMPPHPQVSAGAATDLIPTPLDVPVFAHNPQFGQPDAPVTLIIFTDPACAPCRAQLQQTLQGVSANHMRLVYKFWPQNPQNLTGGLLTEMARRQGVLPAFLKALNADPQAGGDDLLSLLDKAGLPLAQQQNWLAHKTDDLLTNLNEDISQGQQLHLGPPPQYILNGYVLTAPTLPPSRLASYVRRIEAGSALIQPGDYWLTPTN